MKDRVRQALFNILADRVTASFAIDLFAGTGALGLEAISRGATKALFLERHAPTAESIRRNAERLGESDRVAVVACDTFSFLREPNFQRSNWPKDAPWLVFLSPPYDFFVERRDEVMGLIERLAAAATPHSTLVVESDARFDCASELSRLGSWDVREYPPARLGFLRTRTSDDIG